MADVPVGETIGLDAVLAYNTNTHASPTWVEITRAKDVSAPATKNEATLSSRASRFEYKKGALVSLSLEFGYSYKRGTDSVWTALSGSFLSNTAIEFWIGDDTITLVGAKGMRFYGEVMEFPYDQPLEDGMTYNVTVKPTPYYVTGALIEPDLYTIS